MDTPFAFGADVSPADSRTWQHPLDLAAPLPPEGGMIYGPDSIENQHTVGICTAISLVQNAEKALGRRFSPDFQYLLQKRYIDQNWTEGSSIFTALKVGKTYGFLPIEEFTWVTEADRTLPYGQYIAKLIAIPDAEIQRLLKFCVGNLSGYAQLPTDRDSLARGILDSKSGILCRYEVGNEWWTPSWSPNDIDPLRPPKTVVSGHAIGKTYFSVNGFTLANTWGATWNCVGNAHVDPQRYTCTEAWIPSYNELPAFIFKNDLSIGQTSEDVRQLQIRLGVSPTSAFFGPKTLLAVMKYQKTNGITPTGFVGPITRNRLNAGMSTAH